jgi:hypothetical protein
LPNRWLEERNVYNQAPWNHGDGMAFWRKGVPHLEKKHSRNYPLTGSTSHFI